MRLSLVVILVLFAGQNLFGQTEVLQKLESRNPETRKEAIVLMANRPYSNKVLQEVHQLLFTEPQAEVRERAVILLGDMQNENSLSYLKRARELEPVLEVRQEINKAIIKVERIVALGRLESRDSRLRLKAIDDLSIMPHSPDWVVNQLVRSSRFDPNPKVRQKAVEVLGDLGTAAEDAVSGLEEVLKDPVEDVVKAATLAIDKIKVAKGLELLESDDAEERKQGVGIWIDVASRHISGITRLSYWLRSDPDPEVREVIAKALGELGRPEASSVLQRAMVEDISPVVRLKAEEALWQIRQANPDLPE